MLSWSHGCCPAPNLSVFRDIRRTDRDKNDVLDRLAADLYGAQAAPAVRRAWTAFADGYREYPFSCGVMYNGPMHMGSANPLYPTVWTNRMAMVRDGFEKGCERFGRAIALMPEEKRAAAEKELRLFRAETLHFSSCVDQAGFYLARDAKDVASMKAYAEKELASAKEMLRLARGDSRFGFESSNQYFYIPQDLREKIVACRLFILSCARP